MKTLFTFALCLFAIFANAANPSTKSFRAAGGLIVTSNDITGIITYDGSGVVASGTNSSMQVSTNNVASSTMASNINFTAGNNTVLKSTNIGSTAHINYGIASNLTFNSSLGSLVLGTWDGRFGFSNAALGQMSMWIEEPDTGSDWQLAGTFQATNIQLTAIPGTGTNVGITAGGTLFRTTVTGGSGAAGTNVPIGQTLYLDATFGNDATASRTNLLRPFLTPSNSVMSISNSDTLVVRGTFLVFPGTDGDLNTPVANLNPSLGITNRNGIRISGEAGATWAISGTYSNELTLSCPMLSLSRITNAVIENMAFVGFRFTNVSAKHAAIMLDRCENLTFRRCTFSNWQDQAVTDTLAQNTVNRSIWFDDCIFANIGGTNSYPYLPGDTYDGTAISCNASNIVVSNCKFFYNLRNFEMYGAGSGAEQRYGAYVNNFSIGCYDTELHWLSDNVSNFRIANNISIGYPTNGVSAVGSTWLNVWSGSNLVVYGNQVNGFGTTISWGPGNAMGLTDMDIVGNSFQDCTYIPLEFLGTPARSAKASRIRIVSNAFKNCSLQAIRLTASDSSISDNTFVDCNTSAGPHGFIELGYSLAQFSTNMTNVTITGNRFIGSSPEAAIVINSMCYSNAVYGNEIDSRIVGGTRGITNLGVMTQLQPLNLMGTNKILYSDANGRMAEVTIGSGVAFSGGTLTGTGGGGGSVTTNADQFAANPVLTLKNGAALTNPVFNGIIGFFEAGDGRIGWTNLAAGLPSLWLTTGSDNFWNIAGRLAVSESITANSLTITNNAGIGTTTPTNTLDVRGGFNASASIQSNLFLLNLPTNAAPAAFLSVDIDGKVFETATPAGGSGTPAGGSNAVQYASADGTAFAGKSSFWLVPSNSVSTIDKLILADGPVVSAGGVTNPNSLFMSGLGFGAYGAGRVVINTSNQTPRWDFVVDGSLVPTTTAAGSSNRFDVGSFPLPTRTNYTGALQISPNRGAGKVLTDVAGDGVGTWAANAGAPGGGSGAIQFVHQAAFAGTNTFIFNRTNNTVDIYDIAIGNAIRLGGGGLIQLGDDDDLVLGVAAKTNAWYIEGDQASVFMGSWIPGTSNNVSLGSSTSSVSNLWVNKIIMPGGDRASILLYDGGGTEFVGLEAPIDLVNLGAVVRLWENTNAGIVTSFNIAGVTNGLTNVTLTAGQVVSHNGTTYVATNAIIGAINGGNATAGYIGEHVRSAVASQNTGTSSTFFDITSISLTPGDWDVYLVCRYEQNSATYGSINAQIGISATAGDFADGLVGGDNYNASIVAGTVAANIPLTIPGYRISTATNMTVYAKGYIVYSAGQPLVSARLSSRRAR